MKHNLILIFLVGILLSSCEKKRNQEYLEIFEWTVKTFEENDAGFPEYLEKKGEKAYNNFTESIREKIKNIEDQEEFIEVVKEWLHYFRKKHINFGKAINKNSFTQEDMNPLPIKNLPYVKKLSEKTVYISITSALLPYKKVLEKVLLENDKLLRSTPNLIIDIRYSGGGSSTTYDGLIPYLYTNPFSSAGMELRATPLNLEGLELAIEVVRSQNDTILESLVKNFCEQMQQNMGNYFNPFADKEYIEKEYTYSPFPQKIGILCGKGTGSADESFLSRAKQSMKVKVFGTPTAGCADISNVHFVNSPDGKYHLLYGMSRDISSTYMPLDDIGIQPDFLITDDVPESEWIEYVQKILEYGQ